MSRAPLRVLPPSGSPLRLPDIVAALRVARGGIAADILRESVRQRFTTRHVFFLSSGRAALAAGLRALRVLAPGRTEVLLPAFTSFSVPSAVVNAGLRVRLYDLDPETLAPDMESLAAGLGERTLCVVACHLFGYPVALDGLAALCRRHGAMLLDDAAQAMGAHIGGRPAGTCGDLGLFSLSRGKNITAVDGGILITDRDDLATALQGVLPQEAARSGTADARALIKALLLKGCLHPRLYWLPASLPFLHIGASVFDPCFASGGLPPFQAGLAARMLSRLDAINAGRRAVAGRLSAALAEETGIRMVRALPEAEPVFLRLPLLPAAGAWPAGVPPELPRLGVVRSYPLALQAISGLRPFLEGAGSCPGAEMLAANLLTLPTHAYVTEDDIRAMVQGIRGLFSKRIDPATGGVAA